MHVELRVEARNDLVEGSAFYDSQGDGLGESFVYDETGRHRATLTDAQRGAVMSLSKSGGGISLMAMEDSAGLRLRDSKGKARAVVQVTDDSSEIVLKDQQEKTVFSAPEAE